VDGLCAGPCRQPLAHPRVNDGMSDEPRQGADWKVRWSDEPKKRSWAWIWWTLIALLVLYPLSMGPALRYFHSRAVWDAYDPLVRICDAWGGPLEYLKRSYNDLWGVTYNRDPKTGKRTIRWTE
jgi:hypothetical protein